MIGKEQLTTLQWALLGALVGVVLGAIPVALFLH
jgi:hypothetical protein